MFFPEKNENIFIYLKKNLSDNQEIVLITPPPLSPGYMYMYICINEKETRIIVHVYKIKLASYKYSLKKYY